MNRSVSSLGPARIDLLDPFEVSRLGGLELVSEGVVEGFLAGLHRSPRRGFSVEFAEHRMYQPATSCATSTGRYWGAMTGFTSSSLKKRPTCAR
jgi:hypothetical protein